MCDLLCRVFLLFGEIDFVDLIFAKFLEVGVIKGLNLLAYVCSYTFDSGLELSLLFCVIKRSFSFIRFFLLDLGNSLATYALNLSLNRFLLDAVDIFL